MARDQLDPCDPDRSPTPRWIVHCRYCQSTCRQQVRLLDKANPDNESEDGVQFIGRVALDMEMESTHAAPQYSNEFPVVVVHQVESVGLYCHVRV